MKNITNEQEIHQKELEDNKMIQLQDNNDFQFCNTTNLDNKLHHNDKNVTNEQVHHNDVQLEENEINNDMLKI